MTQKWTDACVSFTGNITKIVQDFVKPLTFSYIPEHYWHQPAVWSVLQTFWKERTSHHSVAGFYAGAQRGCRIVSTSCLCRCMLYHLCWVLHVNVKQIFGFKYTMSHSEIDLDPDEQINLRYRLFARAIRINGLSQINALQPYLQARLEDTFAKELAPRNTDGDIDYILSC